MNSVNLAIAWCLAWGNERKPQFDITVLQQMRKALNKNNTKEVPQAVKAIVQQVEEWQNINNTFAKLRGFNARRNGMNAS